MADEKNSAKAKKPNKVARWFKDFFSELKKVTWASFGETCKKTGIVLLVTLMFLLFVMAFDAGLGALYELLISGLPVVETEETASAILTVVRHLSGGLL